MRPLFLYYAMLLILFTLMSFLSNNPMLKAVETMLYAYLPMAILLYLNNRKTLKIEQEDNSLRKKMLTLKLQRFNFFAVKIANVLIFLILGSSLLNIPLLGDFDLYFLISVETSNLLLQLSIIAMIWFFMLIADIYLKEQLKQKLYPYTKELYQVTHLITIATAIIGLSFIAEYLGFNSYTFMIALIFWGFSALLALEIAVRFVAGFFIAKRRGERRRPLYDSYILEVIALPSQAVNLIKDSINRQLGFEFSSSQFFRIVISSAIPLLFLSLLLWWLLSSIVIINPNEEGVVLRFGKIQSQTLTSGLHFKMPYPIDTVRTFDVWQIRRLRVGSHQVADETQDIYLADTPILWTNNHGVSSDELLIVAPPSDMMNEVRSDEKSPSISLVGADITIEYRIADIKKFLVAGANVEQYIKELSTQLSSRALFQFDVDALFCQGRITLPQILKSELQASCNTLNLGVDILHVGIGGVHPPQEVAELFQSTVAALQTKESAIESANRYRIQRYALLTGSVADSEKLLALKDLTLADAEFCDGVIAEKIAKAKSYRCLKINSEAGKSQRFSQEELLYNAAPKTFLNESIMSALEEGLNKSYKYLLIGKDEKLMLRFNFQELSY